MASRFPSGEKPDVFFGQVGLLHQSHWEFKQRGPERPVDFGIVSASGRVHRQLDVHPLDGGRQRQSFARHFRGPQRFSLARISDDGGLAVLWPGLRDRRTADVRRAARSARLADRRHVNWTGGFLPARHQGVAFRGQGSPIADLQPAEPDDERLRTGPLRPVGRDERRPPGRRRAERCPGWLGCGRTRWRPACKRPCRPPWSWKRKRPRRTQLYGLDQPECADFGRNCLLARRLVERGVRFVQLWSGDGPKWDSHDNVPAEHAAEAKRIDRPIAGLLRDLARRGLLDDTLVMFNTEFGRTPFAQSAAGTLGVGRDHNPAGFTVWMAGAGLKPGFAYGATDDFGYRVDCGRGLGPRLSTPRSCICWASITTRLTYYHNGIQRRLTNVHGRVVHELFA